MAVTTSFYYFPNDLFRLKGLMISSLEMDQLGQRLGAKITLKSDKAGGLGWFSKFVMSNLGVDILTVTVEGEEPAVREAIRTIYSKYGRYETKRGAEGELARKMLTELERQTPG